MRRNRGGGGSRSRLSPRSAAKPSKAKPDVAAATRDRQISDLSVDAQDGAEPTGGRWEVLLKNSLAEKAGLTQLKVIAERGTGPFGARSLFLAGCLASLYVCALPKLSRIFPTGLSSDVLGGRFSQVNWVYAFFLSGVYVRLVYYGVAKMERRPPVRSVVFEAMAVFNSTQFLLNTYCCLSLANELLQHGSDAWTDTVAENGAPAQEHTLASLIWLQYHCRQLELLDTAFLVLRKKFQAISFLHIYLRVLNLWGWFFACRFACGGDSFLPTLIVSACQAVVYLYYSLSLLGLRGLPIVGKAYLTEVQTTQFVLCAAHSAKEAFQGRLPRPLALLHLFVIANGLILYTDFHYVEPRRRRQSALASAAAEGGAGGRVTFSFDSCGWLCVYHFGVAHWIRTHILQGVTTDNAGSNAYPKGISYSGSSGGSLVSCVLSAGVEVKDVFEYIIDLHPILQFRPRKLFWAVEGALRKYAYPGVEKIIGTRLRVLLTRVVPYPPFFMGEVVDKFASVEHAVQLVNASCHVPVFAGFLPKCIDGNYYYDGLMWPSALVGWRAERKDRIIRVSALGAPLSDIRIPQVPLTWMILPPSAEVLRGLFWVGYRDAALWFSTEPPTSQGSACGPRRSPPASDSTPIGKGGRDKAEPIDEVANWRAARTLVRGSLGPVGQQLPAVDDASGEDVVLLIKRFQDRAACENFIWGVVFALLGAAVAAAAAVASFGAMPTVVPS